MSFELDTAEFVCSEKKKRVNLSLDLHLSTTTTKVSKCFGTPGTRARRRRVESDGRPQPVSYNHPRVGT